MAKKKKKTIKRVSTKKKAKKKAKKTPRRSRGINPGLKKTKFSKVKQEYHDQDYLDKLSPKDAAWLSKFNDEWLGANLTDNRFHKSKKRQKQIYDANNARNRDIQGVARAMGALDSIEVVDRIADTYENVLIDYIDSKKLKK